VQGERQGEGIGGVIGDSQELADRRDVTLPVHPEQPLGDVEDEVGLRLHHPPGEVLVRLETDDLAHALEGGGDGLDGLGLVPFGVQIRLGEIGAEGSAGGGLVERGDGGVAGFLGRRQHRLLVIGEPYSNRQSLSLVVSAPKLRKSVRSHNSF
jgi:hypothetical protein